MPRRDWTSLELADLRKWRQEGVKVSVIARRLGRTHGSVKQQLQRRGVVTCPEMRRRRKPGQLFRAASRLLRLGKSVTEVALVLDSTHCCISRIRKQLGIPPASRSERAKRSWVFRKARGDKMPNPWLYGRER